MAFQRESSFLQNTQVQLTTLPTVFYDQEILSYSWKAYSPYSTTKRIGCLTAPCERAKEKPRQFDFIPTIASTQFIHSQPLHYKYDQNYIISFNSASVYFLVRPLSCFCSMSKHSCFCLLMQTRRKRKHIASVFSHKVQDSLWRIVALSSCNT